MFFLKLSIFAFVSVLFWYYVQSDGIGSNCWVAGDCKNQGENIYECINGKCRCKGDRIPDRNEKYCVVEIEKPCEWNDECYDMYARCTNNLGSGYCQCTKEYVLHPIRRNCASFLGRNCTDNYYCIDGFCNSNSTCDCEEPLKPNYENVLCLPGLHDDCSGYQKCAEKNAICNNINKCECDIDFKETERNITDNNGDITDVIGVFCLTALGTKCSNNTDCADFQFGAICNWHNKTETEKPEDAYKVCACEEGFVRNNINETLSECLPLPTVDNLSCTADVQCATFTGRESSCVEKKCRCHTSHNNYDEDFHHCFRNNCNCSNFQGEIDFLKHEIMKLKEQSFNEQKVDEPTMLQKIKNLFW